MEGGCPCPNLLALFFHHVTVIQLARIGERGNLAMPKKTFFLKMSSLILKCTLHCTNHTPTVEGLMGVAQIGHHNTLDLVNKKYFQYISEFHRNNLKRLPPPIQLPRVIERGVGVNGNNLSPPSPPPAQYYLPAMVLTATRTPHLKLHQDQNLMTPLSKIQK